MNKDAFRDCTAGAVLAERVEDHERRLGVLELSVGEDGLGGRVRNVEIELRGMSAKLATAAAIGSILGGGIVAGVFKLLGG